MDNVQVTLTICAGFDGGIIVYESDHSDSRLVFGGDHEAATKYLAGRMARLIDDNAKEPGVEEDYYLKTAPRVTEPPNGYTPGGRKLTIGERLQRIDEVTDH